VYVRALAEDSVPAEITFRPEADRVVRLTFLRGAWRAAEERLAWRTDTVAASTEVRTTLFAAVHGAMATHLPPAERTELVYKLGDIFEYRVDVGEEVGRGDSVRLVVERRVDPEGAPREAKILAASLTAGGERVEAFRFRGGSTSADYFDAAGKSLRATFLRAPVEFRRVSSSFGMRHHPVLGVWRMHAGTDYAAASGTPVRAVGDGTVVFAGRKGGYGNVLEIRHRNGYVSRYGHLRGFASGVRAGKPISMGTTIGFVGATGLASGPHLHFEMLVGGAQRDPGATLRKNAVDLLSSRERGALASLRTRLLGRLDRGRTGAAAHVALAE
jgi:murein DD-endopeptidase MepM/ murein hydrolase activator NlpD